MGATPWRFKSSHPHSRNTREALPASLRLLYGLLLGCDARNGPSPCSTLPRLETEAVAALSSVAEELRAHYFAAVADRISFFSCASRTNPLSSPPNMNMNFGNTACSGFFAPAAWLAHYPAVIRAAGGGPMKAFVRRCRR